MPSKNVVKQYLEGGFYHVYNRGVEKRNIFTDDMDYKMFLSYLKNYLSEPTEDSRQVRPVRPVRPNDINSEIKLICYVLMPNHFHMLVKQNSRFGIVSFMRRITNAYTRYFNSRNVRVGPLFQGRYKAILIEKEPYLLHLTRYIHLNPIVISTGYRSDLLSYPYSSYGDYLGKRNSNWLHSEEILRFFSSAQETTIKGILSYQSFVEDYQVDSTEFLGEQTLEGN